MLLYLPGTLNSLPKKKLSDSNPYIFNAPADNVRLLTALKQQLQDLWTRKDLQWSIEHNRCRVNGEVERFGSRLLRKKDQIAIWPAKQPYFQAEPNRILYEDADLFIYNKPPFICSPSFASLLRFFLVHRLDRDTSGVLVLAKNQKTQTAMEELFKQRKIEKEYHALVKGIFSEEKIVEGKMGPIQRREGAVRWGMLSQGGAWSKTHFKRLSFGKKSSYLLCRPITGRTHQIRVHLSSCGCSILGDVEYGGPIQPEGIFRPLLHASQIAFFHPIENKELLIQAPPPEDFVFWKNRLNLAFEQADRCSHQDLQMFAS